MKQGLKNTIAIVVATCMIALVVTALFRREINSDEYAELNSIALHHPNIKPAITKAMEDGRISSREYGLLQMLAEQGIREEKRKVMRETLQQKVGQ